MAWRGELGGGEGVTESPKPSPPRVAPSHQQLSGSNSSKIEANRHSRKAEVSFKLSDDVKRALTEYQGVGDVVITPKGEVLVQQPEGGVYFLGHAELGTTGHDISATQRPLILTSSSSSSLSGDSSPGREIREGHLVEHESGTEGSVSGGEMGQTQQLEGASFQEEGHNRLVQAANQLLQNVGVHNTVITTYADLVQSASTLFVVAFQNLFGVRLKVQLSTMQLVGRVACVRNL